MTGDLTVASGRSYPTLWMSRFPTPGDISVRGHIHPYSYLRHLHTNTDKFPTKPRPMWGYYGCTVWLSGEVDGYVSFLEKLP